MEASKIPKLMLLAIGVGYYFLPMLDARKPHIPHE